MHDILEAVILGVIQGLTEFLPVSSSGHLELGKYILGDNALPEESLLMTVVLHFATALATMIVFRNEIIDIVKGLFNNSLKSPESRFVQYIIISMIPAVFAGLVFEQQIEAMFSQNIILVSIMLICTGFLLLFTYKAGNESGELTFGKAFLVGVSQAIAIIPGISRSGATISTSLYLGINKEKAAKFSFLMVVPLIFGKMAKDIISGDLTFDAAQGLPLLIGGFAAFFTGMVACTLMINIVKNSKLSYFAYYCFVIGVIGLIFSSFHGN